ESSQNDSQEKPRIRSRTCHCPRNSKKVYLFIWGPRSVWFDECFEMDIEPLMRSEAPVSSDALLLISSQRRSLGIKTSSQLKSLSHTHWTVWGARPVQWLETQKFLRGSDLGFKIDQYDMAPVQGFETDVGNMTTVHITYPEIDSPQDPGAQLLLLPLNSSGLKWVMEVLQKEGITRKPKNPGHVISLSFLQYVQQRWLGKNDHFPSLGFIALLYALHTCDQVSLFSLRTDRLSRWSHYWDEEYCFKSNMHSFKEEQQVILKLQCEGKVVIYN
ncbi:hypothetical protein EI555_002423, partial [Monodon monoceros]